MAADPAPTTGELAQYLQTHQLNVAVQPIDGYNQVYYYYNGRQVTLTSANYNHSHAVSSDEYVAWEGTINGSTQIFIYNVLTDALIQLTSDGMSETPFIYHNQVTWQTWDGTGWQIYYYDGFTVQQITTEPYPSVGASTNGQRIIYAEQITSDDWKAQSYDIASGQTTLIREGDQASTAYPSFNRDGTVTTDFVAR